MTPPISSPLDEAKKALKGGGCAPPTPQSTLSALRQLVHDRVLAGNIFVAAVTYGALGLEFGTGSLLHFLEVTAGVTLVGMGTLSRNSIMEKEHDAKMSRTRNRPTVTGFFSPTTCELISNGTSLAGAAILYHAGGPWCAAAAAATYAMYTPVYTWMKRVTPWNTEVGAIVGSLVPVIPALALLGPQGLTSTALIEMAAVIFLWQMPHFMIVAHKLGEQYAAAGYKMRSGPDALRHAKYWMMGSIPVSLAAIAGVLHSGSFAIATEVLGLGWAGYLLWSPWARKYWAGAQDWSMHMKLFGALTALSAGICVNAWYRRQERERKSLPSASRLKDGEPESAK